ncbi:aldehyde dehydrogenase (NADP(+)) [Stappia stellulata]|uniref:aldehyde dehydrogenase (NADP(+)) n=1 Tax=Stappia stellulata TaxID=71235 RepID=UPI00041B300A|nr:aldehyde dehydrogenase (NADP(+)) [Stappia stellulata]
MIIGKHLIAGKWTGADATFRSAPVSGEPLAFPVGGAIEVDAAVTAAEEAFWSFGYSERETRARFLRRVADEIEARGAEITEMATRETGLPVPRIEGERGRTTGQLRLFADHIEAGAYLDRRHDAALPDRAPLPRPEIRLVQRPVGPVAVFGASNFPLAFSVAGGDTASALAAGCPVVVKGHPAHPGTSDLVAQAFAAAIEAEGLHPGVFSLLQGNTNDLGAALVQHPLIKAVGFTGSLGGGRALFDLCAARSEPIPFFGELGAVNPVFILPAALNARAGEIARGWAASLAMGAGQFCTNPGVVILPEGMNADAFVAEAVESLSAVASQVTLTEGIAAAFQAGRETVRSVAGVETLFEGGCGDRSVEPQLYRVKGHELLASDGLLHEVFGPLGIVVTAADADEMLAIARSLEGQLTCTLQMDAEDRELAARLMPVLERKAGRILANGFPTGVEVCDAMVHGGPYPASTNFGATSVGTMAIRRFLRPVSYQNLPTDLLPADAL